MFGSERVNESLKVLKSEEKYFYPTFSAVWVDLCYRKSLSLRSEILGLLLNTLTADCEFYGTNRDNLPLPIQIELSEKIQTSSRFFIAFLQSALNCEHFEKKSQPQGLSISEVIDSQRRVYLRA